MARERDVSPVGTSRFERPYTPPSHSAATSPTTMVSDVARRYGVHLSKTSKASTVDSIISDYNHAYSTAPTSLESSPVDETAHFEKPAQRAADEHSVTETVPDQNMNTVDADEWFARFRSDEDLADPISDECPDRATLAAAYNIPVYAADGTEMPFGQLYHPATATHTRQLVIFVRHFYCGACQAYLKALADSITMNEYFSIPVPTSIIVIGCGHPNLIPFYKAVTGCPFPIFAEPSRALFKCLGMVLSGNIGGTRPDYMKDISPAAWAAGQVTTIRQGLKVRQAALAQQKLEAKARLEANRRQAQEEAEEFERMDKLEKLDAQSQRSGNSSDIKEPTLAIRKRDIIRGGNPFQIGGEFLFEEGEVIWCHRMKNYRNHVEVPMIRKILELDE